MLEINGKKYTVTQIDRDRCFFEDSERSLIVFIYDYKNWAQTEEVKSAFVCGSFTSWYEKEEFGMSHCESLNLEYLAVPFSALKVTGNSGQPEYKFCINGNYLSVNEIKFVPELYVFPSADKNLMIVYSTDNTEEILKKSRIAGKVKSLSDFDLSCREGQEEISNFRLVPGTKKLFRSFHPFYSTGGRSLRYETEKKRLEIVEKLACEEGIRSDINLTDDYTVYAGQKMQWFDGTVSEVTIPPYYQKIIDSNCVCNVMSESGVVPSYEYAYAKPDDKLFSEWIRVVVNFIIDDAHPAPFQIHCAIGTDRTGVFCAILGGLCGAGWNDVAEDYEKTNRMGINEYRSRSLLAQSLQKLLSVKDISEITDLPKALHDYFTRHTLNGESLLTEEQINALNAKLN